MGNNRQNDNAPREFFTLGEHTTGTKHYRFRYDGRVYRILEQPLITDSTDAPEPEETLVLEEREARAAYDAWNHIKRPERFGGGN